MRRRESLMEKKQAEKSTELILDESDMTRYIRLPFS
jgi:hypothetical protein